MDSKVEDKFLQELKIIKRLLAHNLIIGQPQSKQIETLNSVGFGQKEIADTIGTTPNTVNVTLNRIKKAKRSAASRN